MSRPEPPEPSPAPPVSSRTNRDLQRLARLSLILLVGGLVYFVLEAVGGILFTLFISLLLAYILDPVVDWFEAKRIHRATAIFILVAAAVISIFAFGIWVLPPIFEEGNRLADKLSTAMAGSGGLTQTLTQWLGVDVASYTQDIAAKLEESAPEVLRAATTLLRNMASETASLLSSALNVVTIPLFTFYFLRDFDDITAWISGNLPLSQRQTILERTRRVNGVVGGWLRGQFQVMLVLTVVYSVGLGLIGIRLGFAIGLFAGVVSIVPYLGLPIGIGLAGLMTLLDWHGPGQLTAVLGLFGITALVDSYLLTPRLVGGSVGIPPVVVLVALLVGGELFGLLGVLIAVPVAGVLKLALVEALDWYRHSEYYLGSPAAAGAAGNSPSPRPSASEAPPE